MIQASIELFEKGKLRKEPLCVEKFLPGDSSDALEIQNLTIHGGPRPEVSGFVLGATLAQSAACVERGITSRVRWRLPWGMMSLQKNGGAERPF